MIAKMIFSGEGIRSSLNPMFIGKHQKNVVKNYHRNCIHYYHIQVILLKEWNRYKPVSKFALWIRVLGANKFWSRFVIYYL